MQIVLEIVRSITVLMILYLFVEMLTPSGEMMPYIRMVMGLLLIVVMLQPVLAHRADLSFPALLDTAVASGNISTKKILEDGEALSGVAESIAEQRYREDLCRQISSLAMLVAGVRGAETTVFLHEHQIQRINISVTASVGLQAADVQELITKIASAIGNFYGLTKDEVSVSVSGK